MTSQLIWSTANVGVENARILGADLVNPDGTPATTVINEIEIVDSPTAFNPTGITIDPINRRIYYVNGNGIPTGSTQILVVNFDGSSSSIAVTNANAVSGINQVVRDVALDLTNNRIYWVVTQAAAGGDFVRSQSLDASGLGTGAVTTVVADTSLTNPSAIALDVPNGHFYIADLVANGMGQGIVRYDLDGTNPTVIIPTSEFVTGESVTDIAIDGVNGKIYYAVVTALGATDGVKRANLNGSSIEQILSNTTDSVPFNNPTGIALDLINNKIYVSDNTEPGLDDIYQANLDGSGLVRVVTDTVQRIGDIDVFVPPTITLVATDNTATEAGSTTGTFRFTRNGDLSNPLPINYTIAGTATNGADYTNLSGIATILAGQTFVDVVIAPIDDLIVEGNETVTLTLASSEIYDLGATTSGTVTITDNDLGDVTPPTIINFTNNNPDNTVIVGTTLTYTIFFSEDINGATVTAADFNNAGTAAIAIETIIEQSPGVFIVQVTPSTTGTIILRIPTGAVISDVAGNNLVVPFLDNDTVTVNPIPDTTPPTITNINENDADNTVIVGTTLIYTITFSEDINAVTVTAADFNNAGTATIVIGTITETSPGVFTVPVTPSTTGTISLRVPTDAVISDVSGNNLVVPVLDGDTITVNDVAGITVSPTSGLVTTEAGGQATFTIRLNTQPTANVTIPISSNDSTEGSVSPTSITFTPVNFNIAQTVTVTSVDDGIIDGNIGYTVITGAAVSSDPNYNNFNAADVSVTNNDNDVADTTPPTVITIDDGDADNAVIVGNTLTYTISFSEDINAATVTAADFNNAGTATIAIGTITETSPGVFTVPVTHSTTGTIILRIPTGAVISDVAGNNLGVPVQDNNTITVNALPNIVDILINTGTGDGDDLDASNTSFAGSPSGVTGQVQANDTNTNPTFNIFESELEGLNASTNVLLRVNGNITSQSNLTIINFASLPGGGGGNISFAADSDNNAIGSVNFASTSLGASGRNISISGAGVTTNNIITSISVSNGTAGDGGAITLNSSGNISTSNLNSRSISFAGNSGNGGAIALISSGNITTGFFTSSSQASGNGTSGNGGAININANIINGSFSSNNQNISSFSQSNSSGSAGSGGAINITAASINIGTGNISSYSIRIGSGNGNTGNGGAIALNSTGNITTANLDSQSGIGGTGNTANGGTITLNAGGNISTTDLISYARVFANGISGNGGAIAFNAGNNISTLSLSAYSQVDESGTSGNGGAIAFNAGGNISTLSLNAYSRVSGNGIARNGGAITLNSSGNINTSSLVSFSQLFSNGDSGNGGAITVNSTGNVSTNSIQSFSLVNGRGNSKNGGAIAFNAGGNISTTDLVSYAGALFNGNSGNGGAIAFNAGGNISTLSLSAYSLVVGDGIAGNGGAIALNSSGNILTIALESYSLSGTNGFSINSDSGNGGAITLSASGNISTTSLDSYSQVDSTFDRDNDGGNSGNGGAIALNSNGNISTSSLQSYAAVGRNGTSGNGGAIALNSSGNISTSFLSSFSQVLINGTSGDGGAININANIINGSFSSNNQNISSYSFSNGEGSAGSGGAINITAASINIGTGNISSYSIRIGSGNGNTGNGGAIALNSTGNITTTFLDSQSGIGGNGNTANGGTITLNAGGNISTTDLISYARVFANGNSGNGGAIAFNAGGNISTLSLSAYSQVDGDGSAGSGGAIALNSSGNISTSFLSSFSQVLSNGTSGDGGAININANTINGSFSSNNQNISSYSFSNGSGSAGSGGAINITAASINIGTGNIGSYSNRAGSGIGNAGDGGAITINATNSDLTITNAINSFSQSNNGSSGDGGAIALNSTGNISTSSLDSRSQVISNGNSGNGGAIAVNSSGNITASFTLQSFSETNNGNSVNGGVIALNSARNISTGILFSYSRVNNNGTAGNGGAIALNGSGSITASSLQAYSQVSGNGTSGNGGAIALNSAGNISTSTLQSYSQVNNSGNAGNGGAIALNSSGNISTSFLQSYSQTSTGNSGNGGAISFNGSNINITGAISTYSATGNGSVGNGGAVTLTAANNLNVGAINNFTTGTVNYGNITLTGNEINLTGGTNTVRGNNRDLLLQAATAAQAIEIGSTDSGNASILDITATDLAAIANGFGLVTIGRFNSTGNLGINSNISFSDPILLRSTNININSTVSFTDNGRINFNNFANLNPTGAISLNSNERINNTADINLNGGSLILNGFNETLDLLQISSNSVFDFGNSSSDLAFSNSSAQTWTGNLTINNWQPFTGENLRFGTDATGLTTTQLSRIQFTGFNTGAEISSTGFVTPIAVQGSGNNQILNGGANSDIIVGGANTQRLSGGAGNDVLNGGAGADTLIGGLGADIFQYNSLTDSLIAAPDRITDFNQTQGDRFQILTGNPTGEIIDKGTVTGANLTAAATTAFSGVAANQAVFFLYGSTNRRYLGVNDASSTFSTTDDLLVDVTGITFGGSLTASNYFI